MENNLQYSRKIGPYTITIVINSKQFPVPDTITELTENTTDYSHEYTAHISIREYSQTPHTTSDTPEITTTETTRIDTTEINRDIYHNDALATYVTENTVGAEKTSQEFTVTVNGDTYTRSIALPRSEFFYAWYAIETQSSPTPEEIAEIVTTIYPHTSEKSAINVFDRSCERYLHPKKQLPVSNKLITYCPPIRTYRRKPEAYITHHGLSLGKYAYPDDEIEYTELMELYNAQSEYPEATTRNVHRFAVIYLYNKHEMGDAWVSTLYDNLTGDSWVKSLTHESVLLFIALYYASRNEEEATAIASDLPSTVSESEYESFKNSISTLNDDERLEAWGELLPLAIQKERCETTYVLGNVLYWGAGDINMQHNEQYQASVVYNVASDLLAESGDTHFTTLASARGAFLEGIDHQYKNREDCAQEQYMEVLTNHMFSTKGFVDAYSVFGAITNSIEIQLQKQYSDSESTEEALSVLEEIDDVFPTNDVSLSSWKESKQNVARTFLDGALAELCGDTLVNMYDENTETPTATQIRDQYDTAVKKYNSAEKEKHRKRASEKARNYE